MESLVYENSPLADYLQGKKSIADMSQASGTEAQASNSAEEGGCDQDWVVPETNEADQRLEPSSDFAPRGPSKFQSRVRNKIPKPLDLKPLRQTAALGRLYDACSSALNSHISRGDNEAFLEQFGYVIVASQLLNEHSAPSYTSAADILSTSHRADLPSLSSTFGVQGALVTAATSFSIVWLLNWSRSRSGSGLNPRRVGVCLVLLPIIGVVFYTFAKRQWVKYLRHQAVDAASAFISNAQRFDSAASASVVFIQEVELVSRGYRISTPLPPVSRLEDHAQIRRCLRLRRTVSESLFSALDRYIQSQRILQPLADSANLEKYYDIYEISTADLLDAESGLAERGSEDRYSLKSLRILFGQLYSVRKSILCCLLALGADGGRSDMARWSTAIEEMQGLADLTGANTKKMTNILDEEDRDLIPPSPLPTAFANKDSLRAQYRRLNSLSQGIRALHAKMHVIREETSSRIQQHETPDDIESTLVSQYEAIGSDIKGLLQEWEAGKTALLSSFDRRNGPDRLSQLSVGLKLPLSPTASLGGATAVEGSPTDALMALNGESRPSSNIIDDEEIFETVVVPSRNKRASLTREERVARVKEDRARQAAARERADASTNMLKELEMVIKQRPQTSKRVTSL